MNNYSDKIAITTGDINGIGAEITIKALNMLNLSSDKVVIISNRNILSRYPEWKDNYEVIDVPLDGDIDYGKVTRESGNFSFKCLQKACDIRPAAIVTAPVSKESMHMAGHKYNGQTEVLEHFLAHDGQKAEMLFVSEYLNVLLLTRHCPLKDVSSLITKDLIISKVTRLTEEFRDKFSVKYPKLALCALNPHAGEDGILGREEADIIIPAVEELRNKGINITNPLPSDTLFIEAGRNCTEGKKAPYDCYIAMYHDQGLIPVKTIMGMKTVNTTIGLDILRTSPSHGTAFDIAGKGVANPESMVEAVKQAMRVFK